MGLRRKTVGQTPRSAADALVGLCEPAADQGVRPTIAVPAKFETVFEGDFAAVATFRDKFAFGR
jgi:hypothetical protein